jgi:ribonuclease R
VFDPARRWRGGPVELEWKGAHGPEEGDFCVAELPPGGPAFLIEILGADDRPEWDNPGVASQFRLRARFGRAALEGAAACRRVGAADLARREDLRDALVFTIDPADARDHDDALSVSAAGDGVIVGIHIADVSHYVRRGSALDDEALLRGTSCYLPGGVVPMLPERLSADLCSLVPGEDRLALSVFAELDAAGELKRYRFAESVIRSRHRLSYEDVQACFDGAEDLDEDVRAALALLRPVASRLRERRFARGALALDAPETKVHVDAQGLPVRIERRAHLESHALIEEFMLLANQIVGQEGTRRSAGVLYRIHEPPSPMKLVDLDLALKTLGLPRLGAGPDPARALQGLLGVRLDDAHRGLVHRMVLRALMRARYLERDYGHFGLASRAYCHFTSPIRRYPDLHNHRRVREWIHGQRTAAWDPLALAELAVACSATEQNATAAEREAIRVKGLRHLEGRLGDRASGMIAGLVPRGFFVELHDVPVEGFVRVAHELDDDFTLDGAGVRLVGRRTRKRFTLGDTVEVIVARVDVPARECEFSLITPRRAQRRRQQGRVG